MNHFLRIVLFTIVFLSITRKEILAQQEKAENVNVRLMTFNIRLKLSSDSLNVWDNRKEWACKLIEFYDCDILGCQEVLKEQLNDMLNLLPNYGFIGVGREDGKEKGEYSPLFYRKDKYEVHDQSTFWLSQTPGIPGKGWDAACERVVSWAKFKDKLSGKSFFVFNTHFDHLGDTARMESAKLLQTKVKEIASDQPAIVMGDFNASPSSEVYKTLISGNNFLTDTHSIAKFQYGPTWTFHGFGKVPVENREKIDFIFVNQPTRFEILQSAVISEQRGGLFPSDHCPLLLVLKILFPTMEE